MSESRSWSLTTLESKIGDVGEKGPFQTMHNISKQISSLQNS
jgi:hypothetical protein